MLELQPMTEAEFESYKSWLVGDYAQDIANNYRLPIQEALTEASKQITITLGQGLLTPNLLFYLIILSNQTNKTGIGYLWIEVNQAQKRCFIHDLYLHPENRHQGWGRKTLELLEAKMKQAGIVRIGLHVFGNNHIAQDLYTKMGYQVTGLNMQKWLDD
jgi:ribosomal protein S18 acetylase RimI-like enzyme